MKSNSLYPEAVKAYLAKAVRRERCVNANAKGNAATFLCGVSITFSLHIENERVESAYFVSNGCGFVIANAELICELIAGVKLVELEGLAPIESKAARLFADVSGEREHCRHLCFDAVQNALADYRSGQLSLWNGEEALICTCFGVSEKAVENAVLNSKTRTVEEVGRSCNAGTGCGSCQPLIEEIIDSIAR
jgi:NifU-like protein